MPSHSKRNRWLALLGVYIVLLVGGWLISDWIATGAIANITPQNQTMINTMIATASVIYVTAAAIPFVPGAEIGFGLLLVFGANLAILVYACMVLALFLAFLAGRFIPASLIAGAFTYLGLTRAHALIHKLNALPPEKRLAFLTSSAPNRLLPLLLRHRYLALIALLNIPGNSILGGGGGIAFAAGLSGLYRLPTYLISVMVAAAPIPLLFLVTQYLG